MAGLTVFFILLWSILLYTADSYPKKYSTSVHIDPKATADPKSKLFEFLQSKLNQFILKGGEIKQDKDETAIQHALKILSNYFNVKLISEKNLQFGSWYSTDANSKTESEKTPRHFLKRRSVRNFVSPSSNDQHITATVVTNDQQEPGLERENQNQTTLGYHNQDEGDLEMDDHLNIDMASTVHTSVTANGHNQHTHLHQYYSDLHHDIEEATNQNIDDMDDENLNPTVLTNNDHDEPDFHNHGEQTMNQENNNINSTHSTPNVNINYGPNGRNFRNENRHLSDSRNDNEEGREEEHDNIEDLNPSIHTNLDTNGNHHHGEIPDDEDSHLEEGFHEPETTSSLPDDNYLNMPSLNGDHIEGDDLHTAGGETPEGEGIVHDNTDPNEEVRGHQTDYTSENSNSNEENTITRGTRNVGHVPDRDSSHLNSQENHNIANGPEVDDIPSTNTENRNIHNNNNNNNNNGNPAQVDYDNDHSTGPLIMGHNTSQIIDQHIPLVNPHTEGFKTNETNDNLNSTVSTIASIKEDINQTTEINVTRSELTNPTRSIPLQSSQQPSELSTSTPGLSTFSSSLQLPVSISPGIRTSEQTPTVSFPSTNIINHSSNTSTPSTVSSGLTGFQNLIPTINNAHNVTLTMLSVNSTSPSTEERWTSAIEQSSSTSSGPDGNFATANISSSEQDSYTIVAGVTGGSGPTEDSGDEIKTSTKISTEHGTIASNETVINVTEVTNEPVTPSSDYSNGVQLHLIQNPLPNPGRNTTISSGLVPPLTRQRQTISTPSSISTIPPTLSDSTTTSQALLSPSPTSSVTTNTNEFLNTQESTPPRDSNASFVNGLPSTMFTRPTTKSEEISTSTTEGEPKDESTTTTQAMSTSSSQATSGSSTSSTTAKAPPSHKPQCFMELHLSMSWPDFCSQEMSIRGELVALMQQEGGREEVTVDQVQVLNIKQDECLAVTLAPGEQIQVQVYLVNKTHHFDRNLTLVCAQLLSSKFQAGDTSLIQEKLLAVHLYDEFQTSPETKPNNSETDGESDDSLLNDPGVTLALVIAVVGSCCGVGLIALQTIIRRRQRNGPRLNSNSVRNVVSKNNRSFSITSADSIQLYTVSKSAGGVINLGLNLMEPPDPTHPLNLTQLSEFCADDHKLYHEYQKLPNRLPRLSVVPNGEEDKNRYANVLPLAHTRVKLNKDESQKSESSYINANYVTGPNNECQYYIATQAPTTKTIDDFWTMVWQQEAKAIVMLTQLEEGGQCKAATYWPELSGKSAAQRHGDFLIELKQKDVNQEYISSRLEVNNLRKIETRQIQHFWYTCWPSHGTPEPISLVKFVLDTRPRFENTGKPLIVHCSPGTGRTGTFIGLDLCMRQFESRRIVDVMKTVHDLRLERAGAVQNKEQYALLYNAINEYASIVASPVVSVSSSASTLHAMLPD